MRNNIVLVSLCISLTLTFVQSANDTRQLSEQKREWNAALYECKFMGQALAGLSGLSEQEYLEALIHSGDVLGMNYRRSDQDRSKKFVLFQDKKLNWYQAYAYCRRQGLRMATIESKEEHLQLTKLIGTTSLEDKEERNFWVAGSYVGEPGEWVWVSSGQELSSQGWTQRILSASGSTQGQAQNCMTVSYTALLQVARWVRTTCDVQYFFVCEKMW